MKKELTAALKAADAYKVRNRGEEDSVVMIRGMLGDCLARQAMLDGLVEAEDRVQRVNAAQAELNAAQSA